MKLVGNFAQNRWKRCKKLPINFVGNMEARDLVSGEYDVVVADGFSGNVALKSTEGAAMFVLERFKEAIMSSTSAKIGALFMKKTLKIFDLPLYFNDLIM